MSRGIWGLAHPQFLPITLLAITPMKAVTQKSINITGSRRL